MSMELHEEIHATSWRMDATRRRVTRAWEDNRMPSSRERAELRVQLHELALLAESLLVRARAVPEIEGEPPWRETCVSEAVLLKSSVLHAAVMFAVSDLRACVAPLALDTIVGMLVDAEPEPTLVAAPTGSEGFDQ